MRRFIPLAVAALAAAGITTAAATATAGAATTTHAGIPRADVILPPHVYAPYFEAYDTTDGGLAQLSAESGAKYVSLAFLQTPTACFVHGRLERRHVDADLRDRRGQLRRRHRGHPGAGRDRHPVLRRVQRRHHRH